MAILDEIGATIRQLAEGAGSSVVGVGQRWGVGSGIVLGEGTVLTNAHNVRGDRVTVTFADGRTAEGNVAGHDIDGDLAVIGVDTGGVPALPWADGAAGASPAASSTPPRCCPAPQAARFSPPRGSCSRSTPTASARASTWPYPPTRHYGTGPARSPAANQRSRLGSAWR